MKPGLEAETDTFDKVSMHLRSYITFLALNLLFLAFYKETVHLVSFSLRRQAYRHNLQTWFRF